MNSINTINGVLVAAQSDFASHAEDKTLHLRKEEREAWNAKADSSALSGKVDKAELTAHETNTKVHITDEEREKWNARNTKGAVVATQDGLDEHTENTSVHITQEERTAWNEAAAIPEASNAFTGNNTHAGSETFSGPTIFNAETSLNGDIDISNQSAALSLEGIRTWLGFAQYRNMPDSVDCKLYTPGYGAARGNNTITFTNGKSAFKRMICNVYSGVSAREYVWMGGLGTFYSYRTEDDGNRWLPLKKSNEFMPSAIIVMGAANRCVSFVPISPDGEVVDNVRTFVEWAGLKFQIDAEFTSQGAPIGHKYTIISDRAGGRSDEILVPQSYMPYYPCDVALNGVMRHNSNFEKAPNVADWSFGVGSNWMPVPPSEYVHVQKDHLYTVLDHRLDHAIKSSDVFTANEPIEIEMPAAGGDYVFTAQLSRELCYTSWSHTDAHEVCTVCIGVQEGKNFIIVDKNRLPTNVTADIIDFRYTLSPNNSGRTRYAYAFIGNFGSKSKIIKFIQAA